MTTSMIVEEQLKDDELNNSDADGKDNQQINDNPYQSKRGIRAYLTVIGGFIYMLVSDE